MHLHGTALTLLLVFSFNANAHASANATASPASLETYSSTGDRPGSLVSVPQYAGDEERVPDIEDVGLENEVATLLSKSTQALGKQDVNSQLGLEAAGWRLRKEHPHFVFDGLKPEIVDENILSNPWFHVWVKYVESYNAEHPDEEVSIIEKLREKYKDNELAMMLEQAKEDEDTLIKDIGTTLQREQMSIWEDDGVNPRKLYKSLQFGQTPPGLLTGRAYNIWSTYFTKYNSRWSVPLFNQLLSTFGNGDLTSLLIVAKRSKETEVQATELQRQLEDGWIRGFMEPKLVFRLLRLNKEPFNLLDNPKIEVWLRYLDMYRNERRTDVTLNELIKRYYNAVQIQAMIEKATTDKGKELAIELAKELAKELANSRV